MNPIPKRLTYLHLIGVVIIGAGLFLPYSSGLTLKKVNDSSVTFEFAQEYYETTIRGFEAPIGRFSTIVAIVISLIFFFTRKQWFKYLLIPIGVVHLLSQLLIFLSTLAGFGKPFGDSLHIGFDLIFMGIAIGIITTAIKPTLSTLKEVHKRLDEL